MLALTIRAGTQLAIRLCTINAWETPDFHFSTRTGGIRVKLRYFQHRTEDRFISLYLLLICHHFFHLLVFINAWKFSPALQKYPHWRAVRPGWSMIRPTTWTQANAWVWGLPLLKIQQNIICASTTRTKEEFKLDC